MTRILQESHNIPTRLLVSLPVKNNGNKESRDIVSSRLVYEALKFRAKPHNEDVRFSREQYFTLNSIAIENIKSGQTMSRSVKLRKMHKTDRNGFHLTGNG